MGTWTYPLKLRIDGCGTSACTHQGYEALFILSASTQSGAFFPYFSGGTSPCSWVAPVHVGVDNYVWLTYTGNTSSTYKPLYIAYGAYFPFCGFVTGNTTASSAATSNLTVTCSIPEGFERNRMPTAAYVALLAADDHYRIAKYLVTSGYTATTGSSLPYILAGSDAVFDTWEGDGRMLAGDGVYPAAQNLFFRDELLMNLSRTAPTNTGYTVTMAAGSTVKMRVINNLSNTSIILQGYSFQVFDDSACTVNGRTVMQYGSVTVGPNSTQEVTVSCNNGTYNGVRGIKAEWVFNTSMITQVGYQLNNISVTPPYSFSFYSNGPTTSSGGGTNWSVLTQNMTINSSTVTFLTAQ